MVRRRTERGMYLTQKILVAYPNGFCGAIITGPRGIGKSCYALNVAWEVFRNLGYDDDASWNMALDCCKFTIEEVVEFIKNNIISPDKAHLLIWDDAGTYAGTTKWWTDRHALDKLKGVTDTIRTGVCSLLITTPSESDLTKFLRNYDDYMIQIRYHTDGGKYRMAKGYIKRTLPSGKRVVYSKFKNRFYLYLPDWVYTKYKKMRDDVLIKQLGMIEEKL